MFKKIVTLSSLLLILGSAHAITHPLAQTGLVVGGNIGVGSFIGTSYYNPKPNYPVVSPSSRNFGPYIQATVGYDYALNHYFSVGTESGIGYGYSLYSQSISLKIPTSQKIASVSTDTSVVQIPLLATLKAYMPSGFNVFAKAGGVLNYYFTQSNWQEFSYNTVSSEPFDQYASFAPMVEGGIGYSFNHINIFLQDAYSFGDNFDVTKKDAKALNTITLGATYTFSL